MKRLAYIVIIFWSILSPAMIVLGTHIMEASANDARCNGGPIIAVGRRRWCGYFRNERDTIGSNVRVGGIPASVNSAARFINLINSDLAAGGHRQTAAQFIILTMLKRGPGAPKSVSAAQQADWIDRVNSYASISQNGSQSFGPNGRIDWFVSMHMGCGSPQNINTYWQDDFDDVAPFLNDPGNSDCAKAAVMEQFIVFRDKTGNAIYTIRRECMNPMGNIVGLAPKPATNYDLRPSIGVKADGAVVSGAAVELGQVLTFTFSVTNVGADPSSPASCTIYGNTHPGYFPDPPTPTASSSPPGYVPPLTTCPKIFTSGLSNIAVQSVTANTPNQTICRSLFVSPATPTLPSRGMEVCIRVANKPYFRVYGGDVSVGNGLATAPNVCNGNTNAAVVGWNSRTTGGFAGAGVQEAIFALAIINDVSSSLGNNAASAPSPQGLAFANSAVTPAMTAAGQFGGQFGSLPCMPNYYAMRPATTLTLPANVGLMATGNYGGLGTVIIGGGTVTPGKRISVYVDGNVFITGNITYANNWTVDQAPMFRLIVRGNVFIGSAVTRLDGLYVAQKNSAGNFGQLHTCATSAAALPLSGSIYSTCSNQLTFNGAVVANTILLLRTKGSLKQSHPNEISTSPSIAEVFNYSPALWLAQPTDVNTGLGEYDSITSLPPIL